MFLSHKLKFISKYCSDQQTLFVAPKMRIGAILSTCNVCSICAANAGNGTTWLNTTSSSTRGVGRKLMNTEIWFRFLRVCLGLTSTGFLRARKNHVWTKQLGMSFGYYRNFRNFYYSATKYKRPRTPPTRKSLKASFDPNFRIIDHYGP